MPVTSSPQIQATQRHTALVRITHWITVIAFLTLLVTGGEIIISPRWPWEFIQMGNCGSPIELDEGWLLITHGVGMMRNYCMGACLLDKADPSKLLARTPEEVRSRPAV